MKLGKFIWIFGFIFVLSTLAYAIPPSINIQGKLTNPSGSILTGPFDFSFRFYDNFTSGNKLLEINTTATADSRGVYDIVINNVNLTFQDQIYLGVKINDDSEMEPRINLTTVPYTFRANISEDLNKNNTYTVAGLNATGNISLKDKITFGFGQVIDNLVSGWLRLNGSLNVTLNTSFAQDALFIDSAAGKIGIGTASPNQKLTVIGNINATGNITSGTSTIILDSTNNRVGIGTLSPSHALDVAGNASIKGNLSIDSNLSVNGNNLFVDATNGKVGIGTASPADNLVVVGSFATYGSLNATSINSTRLIAAKINVSDSVNVTQTVQAARFVGNGSALTSVIPGGMIAFFPGTCPTGWTEYTSLRGRVVVGTPSGGTGEGTAGTALANLANKSITEVVAHQHAVDPASTTSSSESSHTHSVDPPSTASGGVSAGHTHDMSSHTHAVDPPLTTSTTGTTSSDGAHTHDIRARNLDGSGAKARTGAADDTSFPSESGGAHTHTVSVDVDIISFTSGSTSPGNTGAQSADHTHTTDITSFTSGAGSAHSHSTDISAFTSGANGTAVVDVTMPYIQLTACQAP